MNRQDQSTLDRNAGVKAGCCAVPPDPEQLVEQVRARYGAIARSGRSGDCCGPTLGASCCTPPSQSTSKVGYTPDELATLPEGADLNLGCGAPVGLLDLRPGETVLDLGSGAGLDVFLAAKQVGPGGKAIGVDMTPEMLDRARQNATRSGHTNVEFREGRLEALPVADASVDAVTSNCVINLVPDKGKVFKEVARVLRPGGRLVVSDIVLDGELPDAIKGDLLAYTGCVAGAMPRSRYFETMAEAGLTDIEVLHDVDVSSIFDDETLEEAQAKLERAGVDWTSLRGVVHSITYRAVKR
jgi:SAM-dependent methyltransferase